MRQNKKTLLIIMLSIGVIFLQSFIQKHDDDKPENLKVLPKDISDYRIQTENRAAA